MCFPFQWLKQAFPNNMDTDASQTIYRLLSALPVLPRDLLQGGIEIIVEESHRLGIFNGCCSLFDLLQRNWLEVYEDFSVFGSHERTNYGM